MKTNELQSLATQPEAVKSGILRDDLAEDVLHRNYLANQKIDENRSLRITPIFNAKNRRHRFITSGKRELQEELDRVLKTKRVEHIKDTITVYPGDESFNLEEFKKIALPQLSRTFQAIRERIGLPNNVLENVTSAFEQDAQQVLDTLLSQPKQITEALKSDVPTR